MCTNFHANWLLKSAKTEHKTSILVSDDDSVYAESFTMQASAYNHHTVIRLRSVCLSVRQIEAKTWKRNDAMELLWGRWLDVRGKGKEGDTKTCFSPLIIDHFKYIRQGAL